MQNENNFFSGYKSNACLMGDNILESRRRHKEENENLLYVFLPLSGNQSYQFGVSPVGLWHMHSLCMHTHTLTHTHIFLLSLYLSLSPYINSHTHMYIHTCITKTHFSAHNTPTLLKNKN